MAIDCLHPERMPSLGVAPQPLLQTPAPESSTQPSSANMHPREWLAVPVAARIRRRFQALWNLMRTHPTVVLVPLLVFSVISAVGVAVVYVVARHQEDVLRATATNMATGAATALRWQLMSMVQPVAALSAFLSSDLGTNYTLVKQLFPGVAAKLLAQVISPTQDMWVALGPQAISTNIFPLNNITNQSYGVDLLGNPSKRNATLALMRMPSKVYIKGPVMLQAGYAGITATMPVFISGVQQDVDFGLPWPTSPFCPPDLCWQEATQTKFWGTVAGAWPLKQMLRDNGQLARLRSDGFRYVLSQPAANASMPATPGYDYVVIMSSHGDIDNPVAVPVDFNTDISFQAAPWLLSVSPRAGWQSAWEQPMYAVVVVISLAISLLLMAFMISRIWRVEHQDLLFSLVPKSVVKKLKESGAIRRSSRITTSAIPPRQTPAEVLLDLLADCLSGTLPQPALVVQLRAALLSLQDIYRPADTSQELRAAIDDEDVANNLMQLLTHDTPWNRDRDRDTLQPELMHTQTVHQPEAWFEDLEGGMLPPLETAVANTLRHLNTQTDVAPQPRTPVQRDGSAVINSQHSRRLSGPPFMSTSAALPKGLHWSMLSDVPTRASNVMLDMSPAAARDDLSDEATTHTLAMASRCAASITRAVDDELQSILGQAYSSWTFDAFALNRASNGHPLSTLGFYLMHKTGLMQQFKLPPQKVARFFRSLEEAYIENPYHSRTHAADVLQTLHVILSRGGFLHSYVDPVRHLACILAAAAHDVEHIGLTNDFLCSTEDPLALRYNDRSPMENHHLATLFTLLKRPGHDFMRHLGKDTRDVVRKVAIEMVMATDMKQHMTMVSQFKSVHQASRLATETLPGGEALAGTGPVFIDETERLLSLQMAMKMADLGHLAESLEVHKMWVSGLEAEFFEQGDKERQQGIPITPLFDRTKPGITKSQVGFFDFVVMPLFSSFSGVFTDVQPLVDFASENLRFWKTHAGVKSAEPITTICLEPAELSDT